jgi:hypothetical protein
MCSSLIGGNVLVGLWRKDWYRRYAREPIHDNTVLF